MKILIPILIFARSGGSRVLSELANEWVKSGNDVAFLCPDSSDAPYFPTIARILWVNDKGQIAAERNPLAKPSGRYHLQSLYAGLKAVGAEYELILANQSLTAWPVALASCGNARKAYYVQAYEAEYYVNMKTAKDLVLAAISALSYQLPLKRIVNAPVYFRYKNLRASDFVPPGMDLDIFKPLAAPRDIDSNETIIIGCIGRHEPEKGTIYVLQAFEQLAKLDPRFRLRVAYGNLPQGWQHEKCEVVVPKSDTELADYYRSVDILVSPGTVQHGAPHYPVLEALATGAAVVTTGYMGATEDTAWLVKNKDVQTIVERIQELVRDGAARRAKIAAGLLTAQAFSWKTVSAKMMAIFVRTLFADNAKK